MFERLANFCYYRRRRVVVVAAVVFLGGLYATGSAFEVLKPFGFEDPDSESIVARERLEQAGGQAPGPGLVALIDLDQPLTAPETQQAVREVQQVLGADREVAATLSFYDTNDPGFAAADGSSTYVLAFFNADVPDEDAQDAFNRLDKKLERREDVRIGGLAASYEQIGSTVERDLRRAEAFAFPILFLLSFWVFRSLVAASLPLLVGGLAIVGAIAGLRILAEATDLSVFAVNLITGMGLGLSIDYSLFIVSRYREEIRKRGGASPAALRRTMKTAGRTVLFSALTVAAAMGSLLVFPQNFLFSMGVGGSLVALMAATISLTVLPAVLSMLRHRVNALAPKRLQEAADRSARPAKSGFWYRLSRFVMRRPIGVATLAAVVMLAAGFPFLGSEYTFADAGILPKSTSARQVSDVLEGDKYPPNRGIPIQIAIEAGPNQARQATEFAGRVGRVGGIEEVRGPTPVGREAQRLDVYYGPDPYSDRMGDVVRELRDIPAPFEFRVAGVPAEFIDQNQSLIDHLPLALVILVTTTLLILFLMTGSLILPIKSVIMNILTVSVAFGALVFVFQDGRFESLLAYTSQDALDSSNALLIFAVIFGLSTDYGVFLLTRIKEARDAGAGEINSVAIGMERTGRVITAAALLIAVALGAFITSEIIFIKQFALGATVGILVDATIVRGLLVPALMRLLGRWNWWAPGPLRRIHERFGLSEG